MGGFFCIVKIKKFSPCIMRGKLRGFLILPDCISQLLSRTLYLENFIRSQDITMFEPP